MRELIISNYDCGCEFKAVVIIDNQPEIVTAHRDRDMQEYDLYDLNSSWFDTSRISKENQSIQSFDRVVYCSNGGIQVFWKGKDY